MEFGLGLILFKLNIIHSCTSFVHSCDLSGILDNAKPLFLKSSIQLTWIREVLDLLIGLGVDLVSGWVILKLFSVIVVL